MCIRDSDVVGRSLRVRRRGSLVRADAEPYPLNLVYGVDLLGAACGCLCVIALLDVMDAPSAAFLVASMAALAGLCLRARGSRQLWRSLSASWQGKRPVDTR